MSRYAAYNQQSVNQHSARLPYQQPQQQQQHHERGNATYGRFDAARDEKDRYGHQHPQGYDRDRDRDRSPYDLHRHGFRDEATLNGRIDSPHRGYAQAQDQDDWRQGAADRFGSRRAQEDDALYGDDDDYEEASRRARDQHERRDRYGVDPPQKRPTRKSQL